MRPLRSSEDGGPAVLVPQTSFLGDVVLTTPLLTALRTRLQPRRLTVLVRPEARVLVEGHPAVDDVLLDDKHGRDHGVRGARRVAARLRAERFDVAVSPHRSLRTALVLAAARIPRRVGFASSRGAWLFHERVARDPGQHDVRRNLALLGPFGGADAIPDPFVPVAADAAARAAALVGEGSPIAVLAPGSVWATKRWTSEGFAAVGRALRDDGLRVVVIGGAADAAVCAAVAAACPGALSLAGRTDLGAVVALVDRAVVLVGNDSAPMHIACARGVPTVAVFCATTPALGYGPWGPRSRVVDVDLACRPCGRHGGHRCPRGTEDCMRLVEAADVLAAVRAVWRREAA